MTTLTSGVEPPARRGFWSPLKEVSPRLRVLRNSIIHDPMRRTRIKALLIGEATILITVIAFDWFLRSHAIPFNVWTSEKTWQLFLCGLGLFALTYVAPVPTAAAISNKHFQRAMLLFLLWMLAMLLLGAVLLGINLLLEARPHLFWFSPFRPAIVHFIHRTGPWGLLGVCFLWLGPVLAVLMGVQNKWPPEMKRERDALKGNAE